MTPISVLIVDDHPVLREGLGSILNNQDDMVVVAEAENGQSAIAAYAVHRPDIVLMDLQMPGLSGVETTEALCRDWPDAKIIVLTTFAGDARALKALRAGATGYLLKTALRHEIIAAIRTVYEGGKHLDTSVASSIAHHILDEQLTERETTVLTLAARGNTNKQIAEKLQISDETVKGYMKLAFPKLGAKDRTHAVALAAKRGLIEI